MHTTEIKISCNTVPRVTEDNEYNLTKITMSRTQYKYEFKEQSAANMKYKGTLLLTQNNMRWTKDLMLYNTKQKEVVIEHNDGIMKYHELIIKQNVTNYIIMELASEHNEKILKHNI